MSVDRDLERWVAAGLAQDEAWQEPDHLADTILATTGRMRPRPRWLALIKEPPMRISSVVAVGSPAVRSTSVLILTAVLAALAAGAVVAGTSFVQRPGPIVVAPDGSGTTRTISEAVSMARDGDTIMVRPGTYHESVTIERNITLVGDGPSGSVVIEFTEEGPAVPVRDQQAPFGLRLEDSDAQVHGLVVRGPGVAVSISGGTPELNLEVGPASPAIDFTGGTTAKFADSSIHGSVFIGDGASPTLERIEPDSGVQIAGRATAPTIRDSRFVAIDVREGAVPTVERNEMIGILADASNPIIRGNVFRSGGEPGSSESRIAIELVASDGHVIGNWIRDHSFGVSLEGGGAPRILDNVIESNEVGIALYSVDATPLLRGNRFCRNGTNLQVPDGSLLTLDANTFCEDRMSPSTMSWSPEMVQRDWPGALRPEGEGSGQVVHAERRTEDDGDPTTEDPWVNVYEDPHQDEDLDAYPWLDITDVRFGGRGATVSLVSTPDPVDPSIRWHAYGLVIDTDRDGRPDVRLGVDNAPNGEHRVWQTELVEGRTLAKTGPPYGMGGLPDTYYPGEVFATDRVVLRGVPAGRFYAWASAIEGGRVVAIDFAPSSGWLDPLQE